MENKETVEEFCDKCGNDACCCIIRNLTDLEYAAEKWVFESNGHKWSNNDNSAGDNYGSFISGAKWQSEKILKLHDDWETYNSVNKNFDSNFLPISFKSFIENGNFI